MWTIFYFVKIGRPGRNRTFDRGFGDRRFTTSLQAYSRLAAEFSIISLLYVPFFFFPIYNIFSIVKQFFEVLHFSGCDN